MLCLWKKHSRKEYQLWSHFSFPLKSQENGFVFYLVFWLYLIWLDWIFSWNDLLRINGSYVWFGMGRWVANHMLVREDLRKNLAMCSFLNKKWFMHVISECNFISKKWLMEYFSVKSLPLLLFNDSYLIAIFIL